MMQNVFLLDFGPTEFKYNLLIKVSMETLQTLNDVFGLIGIRFMRSLYRGLLGLPLVFLINVFIIFLKMLQSSFGKIYLQSSGVNDYLDSYGFHPSLILKLLGSNYQFNTKQIQAPLTTVCGQYCVPCGWG